jgi:hypothetical protein
VTIIAGIILAIAFSHAERLPSADVFEHPFTNHSLCYSIYYTCVLRTVGAEGWLSAGGIEGVPSVSGISSIESVEGVEGVKGIICVSGKLVLMPRLTTMTCPRTRSCNVVSW